MKLSTKYNVHSITIADSYHKTWKVKYKQDEHNCPVLEGEGKHVKDVTYMRPKEFSVTVEDWDMIPQVGDYIHVIMDLSDCLLQSSDHSGELREIPYSDEECNDDEQSDEESVDDVDYE